MSKKEKIEFILAVFPNLVHIINFATDIQIDRYVEEARDRLERHTLEMAYV